MKTVHRNLSRTCWSRVCIGVVLLQFAATAFCQTPACFEAEVAAGGEIYALAQQPDGKILVGGQIYRVAGQPCRSIARLRADGTRDPDFHASADGYGLSNPYIMSILLQSDGKILVEGSFYRLCGEARTNIGRLHPDGTLDRGFNPTATQNLFSFGPFLGIQADGGILVRASSQAAGGQTTNYLARLRVDGSLDPSFKPPAIGPGEYAHVSSVAIQEDGRILVAGQFSTLGGLAATNMARLLADGSPDPTFASPTFDATLPWYAARVDILALQPDGRILAGGSFSMLNGVTRTNLARLFPNGNLDLAFDPQIGRTIGVSLPSAVVLQADGRILVGGYFSWIGPGQPFGFGRLNPDGTPDEAFVPGVSGQWIHALALQADGSVLVGGDIYLLGRRAPTDLARWTNTGPATQDLRLEGDGISWRRGGTSPEVSRTSFDYSTNGLDWVGLGAGARAADGWWCASFGCPSNATIRARGFVPGGEGNMSSGLVETMIGRPGITTPPVNRTNNAGTVAEFSVLAGGSPPVSHRWLKDGRSLGEQGKGIGADSTVLTLSNVVAGDAGAYSVVVSNADGVVTSALAMLWVVDPAINVQPTNQLGQAGLPVQLAVEAGGTALSFQWRKDGANLNGATTPTLAIAKVQWTDRGVYDVVVSNAFGCLTSEVAVLNVNMAPPDLLGPTNIVGAVTTLAVQPDGKILVASEWSEVSEPGRYYFLRLNADGTPDDSFDVSLDPDQGRVNCVAVLPDGKLLVGGGFHSLGGAPCTNLARLNANGTLDDTVQLHADNAVSRFISLPDGRILLGGGFSSLGGVRCSVPARLNADCTLDQTFQAPADGLYYNNLLGLQPDGKILVGVQLMNSNGWSFCRIERLNTDGAIDHAFANPEARRSETFAEITEMAVQPDGRLLVSGSFESLAGVACTNIGRLNPDGTFDTSFVNPVPMWTFGGVGNLGSFAFQTDGKVLGSGYFLSVAGQARAYLARFEADGSLDETFRPDPDAPATCVAIQPDGKILLGGSFGIMAGAQRWVLARLNNTAPAIESLICDGSAVFWLRAGASPEIWSALFEASADGVVWSSLGVGTRIPGGWQLTGLALPAGTLVRARGLVAAFRSSWFIETCARSGPRERPKVVLQESGLGGLSNRFCLSYSAGSGETVLLECSSNLETWAAIATNWPGAMPRFLTAPRSSTPPWQFYRARLWP